MRRPTDQQPGGAVVLSERDADVGEHDEVRDEHGGGVRLRLARDLVLDRALGEVRYLHVRVAVVLHVLQVTDGTARTCASG